VRFRKVHELAPREAVASNEGWAAHQLETQDVEEATNDNLAWADAIIFGTPTRYGLPTAQLKQFLEMTGGLWVKGALVNKVCSSFTSTDTSHGGQETTIINLNTTFYNWGAYSANLEEGESFTTLELKINGSVANKPATRCSMLVDWPNSIITGGCSDQIQSVQMATLSIRDHPSLRPLVFALQSELSRSRRNDE
jgi:multimeric flavodoxin WrbA